MLALLMTTGATAAFLSFGGVGYAVDAVNTAVGGGSSGQTASDDQYGGQCVEYVNPHGQTIPPAGLTPPGTNPKGGENPDGFYQIGDPSDAADVFVIDLGSGTAFGPYPGGTAIKYTQAPGKTPSEQKIGSTNGQAGAVLVHITGTGDFQIVLGGDPILADLPGTSTSEVIRRQPRRLGPGGPSPGRPSRLWDATGAP